MNVRHIGMTLPVYGDAVGFTARRLASRRRHGRRSLSLGWSRAASGNMSTADFRGASASLLALVSASPILRKGNDADQNG
jgi:hypothetical protein